MRRPIFRRTSYANVASTAALVLALTGGAYAAGVLPAKSVGTKQLKNDAVTSAKVKNGTLSKADLKKGAKTKFTFTGTGVSIVGPVGPTLGSADIVDAFGVVVAGGGLGLVAVLIYMFTGVDLSGVLGGLTITEETHRVPVQRTAVRRLQLLHRDRVHAHACVAYNDLYAAMR